MDIPAMSSPWTDLLFLHGYIHDPALARRLARTGDAAPGPGRKAPAGAAPARPDRAPVARPALRLAAESPEGG
jgi:hypothetical protein